MLGFVNCSTDLDDLYQVALLVDQLKHDDVQMRITAFGSLERIGKNCDVLVLLLFIFLFRLLSAAALGVDRTRDELIPFISGKVSNISIQSNLMSSVCRLC